MYIVCMLFVPMQMYRERATHTKKLFASWVMCSLTRQIFHNHLTKYFYLEKISQSERRNPSQFILQYQGKWIKAWGVWFNRWHSLNCLTLINIFDSDGYQQFFCCHREPLLHYMYNTKMLSTHLYGHFYLSSQAQIRVFNGC